MKSNTPPLYRRLYRWAYSTENVAKLLRVLDVICVALIAIFFIFALIFTGVREMSLMPPIKLIFTTGIPFLAVSLMRNFMNMPRPCKVFELDFLPSEKSGKSFPSRHVFSAFSIGTALCFSVLPLGIVALIFGIVIAFCRVCLGNHFVRDVIAGALIGIGCSVIGMLIL